MPYFCKSFNKSETNHQAIRPDENGNAMVYVLLIIVLFAALSFILGRQTDSSETAALNEEQTEIYAGQLLQNGSQVKQAIDMMLYSGSTVNDPAGFGDALDFTLPGEGGFGTAPHRHKVFHPEGGGVSMPRMSTGITNEVGTNPSAGWYVGSFNNVTWTKSSANDVIMTAHQIKQDICQRLNKRLTGSDAVPEIASANINQILIDGAYSTVGDGNNVDFSSAHCAACVGRPAMCVKENGVNAWSFYFLIADE